jgi:hypothetical protein
MSPHTLLHRQAHPNFMDGTLITSQVFMPFPKDDGKLSVDDGGLASAEASYRHYTNVLKFESTGVWSVTKQEANDCGVAAGPDPLPGNPAHAMIDFASATEKACRKIAKRLKAFAVARGCQYQGS